MRVKFYLQLDDRFHVDKKEFQIPFVCGAKDLGEALRRIAEGASMIRTKGEPGTGDIVQAVRHMRMMNQEIRRIQNLREDELYVAAKELQVPVELVQYFRTWKTTSRELRSRRCSNTCRCCSYDAARCRRCVCWLRDFQIR